MIVIDAGHGGNDPGASGNGITEKDYTLDISLFMAELFRDLGVPVALTRTTDETLAPEERVSRIMTAFGNNQDVIVISNHLNAGGGDGAEVIYALRNKDTLARIITEEIAKEGQNIRKWYQRRLPSDTSKDYYFIHRNTGVTEAVIVEYGFVDNASDADQIKNNWRRYAEAVVRAVAIYKGIPYTGVVPTEGYVVKSGDTLWSIARKFGVTANELKEFNNLTSNLLTVGQVLQIPTPKAPVEPTPPVIPPSDNTYTVASGDSLWSIARKFGVTVQELRNLNNLTSDLLSLGQVLLIPIKEPAPPVEGTIYTVVSGDNLYSIASRFGTTVNAIREANNLTSNLLSVGQTLIIPTTEVPVEPTPITTYTVARGDNLYSIANRFGTTVDAIKRANNLISNLLSVGQTLVIPAAGASTGRTYVVKSGDSLWTIANRFGLTVNQLRSANNLTTDLLSIGQVLQIP